MELPVSSTLCRRTIRGSERRRATCGRSPAISFRRAPRLCCSITGTGLPGFSPLRRAHRAWYRSADPFQALNISVMDEGGCQQWHFDTNEVAITLLLQAPAAGGEFEYVPLIRSAENEDYEAVKRVLDGDRNGVVQLSQEAGMLVLFKGHRSLHRVAPVRGARRRFQSILTYNPRPGVVGSLESSILHYGPRVETA